MACRKNIVLEPWQEEFVSDLAKKNGLSFSEAVRVVISSYVLSTHRKKKMTMTPTDLHFKGRLVWEKRGK